MNKQKQAFTLVELIVVITIIAILGTIAFISLQGYSASSRDSVRISDVSNMKTALELFNLNAGKYPLPDDKEDITYENEILWYQGVLGSSVVSQLSKNLNKIPTDPLTDKKYIYSTINTKNEFQILTLLEGDLALNSISQTNAASTPVIPRVDGQYNGVFIKSDTYYVPTPSIITSEYIELGVGLALNDTNIKSQIVTGGANIPSVGSSAPAVGKLNINLSVFTGSIDSTSTTAKKIELMDKIKAAYAGSTIANQDIYKTIIESTSPEVLIDRIVLKTYDAVAPIEQNIITPTECTTGMTEITLANGQTWSCINLGATTVWDGVTEPTDCSFSSTDCNSNLTWIGNYYEWGKNDTEWTSYWSPSTDAWGGSLDDTYTSNGAGTTSIGRQGPCSAGWHVPSIKEWQDMCNIIMGVTCESAAQTSTDITNKLKLPFLGYRGSNSGNYESQIANGFYRSSSPSSQSWSYGPNFDAASDSVYLENADLNYVSYGVRCIKN